MAHNKESRHPTIKRQIHDHDKNEPYQPQIRAEGGHGERQSILRSVKRKRLFSSLRQEEKKHGLLGGFARAIQLQRLTQRERKPLE